MPNIKNPSGQIVCVPVAEFNRLCREQPESRDYDGKLSRAGFRPPTQEEQAAWDAKETLAMERRDKDILDIERMNAPRIIVQQVTQQQADRATKGR